MVYPNDQNPKNLVLFYLLPSVPEAACGKSPELRVLRAGGIVRVGKLKLTFHCFLLCVCVPVCAKYFWPRETIWPVVVVVVVVVVFLSVGIPVFLLMQCKSGSLHFLHKSLNETAYLRSMESPGWELRPFSCALLWVIDRQVRDRWEKGTIQRPMLYSL